jgi:hypothetical protein
MPSMEFELLNPSNRAAADLSLRPHGHWHRQIYYIRVTINCKQAVGVLRCDSAVLMKQDSGNYGTA